MTPLKVYPQTGEAIRPATGSRLCVSAPLCRGADLWRSVGLGLARRGLNIVLLVGVGVRELGMGVALVDGVHHVLGQVADLDVLVLRAPGQVLEGAVLVESVLDHQHPDR